MFRNVNFAFSLLQFFLFHVLDKKLRHANLTITIKTIIIQQKYKNATHGIRFQRLYIQIRSISTFSCISLHEFFFSKTLKYVIGLPLVLIFFIRTFLPL